MKEKTKKERIGKVKINEKRALDLLENYVSGRIKPKDKNERELFEKLFNAAIKRLTPGKEKETTLPEIKEINLTKKQIKEIVARKPPAGKYLEVSLIIINAPELTEYQEGENGSLIEECYRKGISFLVSPRGPLTHLGKIMFYGILPHLKKNYQGKGIIKYSNYDIIKKGKLKKGGSTYKEIDEESLKIINMHFYHPSIIEDKEGNGKTLYRRQGAPLFLYDEKIGETGRKEKNYILIENPILNGSVLDQYKAGYRLNNILKATNKHEISVYLFMNPKLKPGNDCYPIAENKLIQHAGIHAKKKIHQRRALKIALEEFEKNHGFLHGKPRENIYFFNRPRGPISKEERDQIVKLLNQGKTPTGKNIMEQWRKDQEEKERTRKEEAQLYTRKQRIQATLIDWHIKLNRIKEITDHYETDYLERMIKKVKSKNPKNPAGLFLRIIKNY